MGYGSGEDYICLLEFFGGVDWVVEEKGLFGYWKYFVGLYD